jgi:hypothetical protein
MVSSTYRILGLFFDLQWINFSIVNGNEAYWKFDVVVEGNWLLIGIKFP